MSRACLVCGDPYEPFINDIHDYEYGVVHDSALVMCAGCGLVTHEPPVTPAEIPSLYPANYLAHSDESDSRGVYGRLKGMLARRAAQAIVSRVPKNGVFLEVGCGNGHLIRRLAALRPDISFVGVDIEDVGISDIERFTFHHGQFEDADVAAHSIDLIYCSNLIEHVPDPRRFLAKCLATLKGGGTLYGVTPDHLSLDRRIFGKYWAGYHYPRHTFVFNHKNLARLLEAQGFARSSIRGGYSFWYLSLANRFLTLPGTKKRGLAFAAVSALFLPLDLMINMFVPHGSMTFIARSPSK